jgi:pimeloyl-ACP methyl ester carboxylesterase
VCLVLGLAAPNVLAYLHARAMTRFARTGEQTQSPEDLSFSHKVRVLLFGATIPHPRNQWTPASVGLAYETHQFQGEAGMLEAWVIPVPSPKGLAVLFHGFALSKARFLDVASYFHDLGWTAVLMDFRGCGGSQGDRTTVGWDEAKDVAVTLSWVRKTLGESAPVLFGHSMGAVAILRAVAVEGMAVDVSRSRRDLIIENAVLRHQINILRRGKKRPRLEVTDRLKLLLGASLLPAWRQAIAIVQPDTLLRWHRAGSTPSGDRAARPVWHSPSGPEQADCHQTCARRSAC